MNMFVSIEKKYVFITVTGTVVNRLYNLNIEFFSEIPLNLRYSKGPDPGGQLITDPPDSDP
jgi:hypothetical protein